VQARIRYPRQQRGRYFYKAVREGTHVGFDHLSEVLNRDAVPIPDRHHFTCQSLLFQQLYKTSASPDQGRFGRESHGCAGQDVVAFLIENGLPGAEFGHGRYL
jgi:hypothetical protein